MRPLILCLLLFVAHSYAQPLHINPLPPQTDASFRGLSVVDDSTAWVSGSKGYVGRSTDGGLHWSFKKVPGYEQCDFRSIYAFNARAAVIANAGAPAYILITQDGGNSWETVYHNNDSAAFIDGITFADDKNGIIYGDPIKGRLFLLRTKDGGHTWNELTTDSRPALDSGEASFAASGTSIRLLPKGNIAIATGGTRSRLLLSADMGAHWRSLSTPMLHGIASAGIFSIASGMHSLIIAGGDYKRDTLRKDHIFYSKDNGITWHAPQSPTRGYRECVEFIDDNTVIAVGPGGADISYSSGVNWRHFFDDQQYHVIRKSRQGNLVIMAGGGGKLAIINR